MVISIVGVGLIGGSISLALKKNGFASLVIGVDNNKENGEIAIHRNLVDEIMELEESIEQGDVIIIATPVDVATEIAKKVLDFIENKGYDNKVVFDVGSTKKSICSSIQTHNRRKQFVAVHPIAGTENFGPNAAFLSLMFDKNVIICDTELSSDKSLEIVENILKSMYMQIHYMDSKEHDNQIAFVSHLSHLSSYALGLTVLQEEKNKDNIFLMAGSGFESTVRLAKSSSSMWGPIFNQNKANVIKALDAYLNTLSEYKNAIIDENQSKLIKLMNDANKVRKVLDSNNEKR